MIAIVGLLAMSFFNFLFHNLGLLTATSTISLWLILRGLFLPMAYNPAQISFLADVPTELVGRASAITNILGRVSSSLGIAVSTSVSRPSGGEGRPLCMGDEPVEYRGRRSAGEGAGTSGGSEAGRVTALAALQGLVQRTAFVGAVDDMFIITSVLTLVGLIPAFFLKKSSSDKRAAAMDS